MCIYIMCIYNVYLYNVYLYNVYLYNVQNGQAKKKPNGFIPSLKVDLFPAPSRPHGGLGSLCGHPCAWSAPGADSVWR